MFQVAARRRSSKGEPPQATSNRATGIRNPRQGPKRSRVFGPAHQCANPPTPTTQTQTQTQTHRVRVSSSSKVTKTSGLRPPGFVPIQASSSLTLRASPQEATPRSDQKPPEVGIGFDLVPVQFSSVQPSRVQPAHHHHHTTTTSVTHSTIHSSSIPYYILTAFDFLPISTTQYYRQ